MHHLLLSFNSIYSKIDVLQCKKDLLNMTKWTLDYIYISKYIIMHHLIPALLTVFLVFSFYFTFELSDNFGLFLVSFSVLNLPISGAILLHGDDVFKFIREKKEQSLKEYLKNKNTILNYILTIIFPPSAIFCSIIFIIYSMLKVIFDVDALNKRKTIDDDLKNIDYEISNSIKKGDSLVNKIENNNEARLELLKVESNKYEAENRHLIWLKDHVVKDMQQDTILIEYLENKINNKFKIQVD